MRVSAGEAFLFIVFVLAAAAGWWFLGQAARDFDVLTFAMGAACLLFAAACMVITAALDEHGTTPLIMGLVFSLAAFVLALELNGVSAVAALLSFLFLSIGVWRMRAAREEDVHFHLSNLAQRSALFFLWATGVVLGAALFLNITSRDELLKAVPQKVVAVAFPVMAQAVASATGISIDTTVDGFYRQLVKVEDPRLSPRQKEELLERVVVEQREELAQRTGLSISEETTFRELVSMAVERQFRMLLSLFGEKFLLGFLVVFLLIFQLLLFPAQMLLRLIAMGLLWLLRAAKLIDEREETIVRKVPQWS